MPRSGGESLCPRLALRPDLQPLMADKPTRSLSLGLEATGWGLVRAPLEMRLWLAACQPLLNLSRPRGHGACTETPSVLLHVQTWVCCAVLPAWPGSAWRGDPACSTSASWALEPLEGAGIESGQVALRLGSELLSAKPENAAFDLQHFWAALSISHKKPSVFAQWTWERKGRTPQGSLSRQAGSGFTLKPPFISCPRPTVPLVSLLVGLFRQQSHLQIFMQWRI